jgi:hypothetical protein
MVKAPKIFRVRINPAFHRHRRAAAIVGRILAAFGELEYIIAEAAGKATNNKETVLRALYRLRATSSRIDLSDTLMRPICMRANLVDEHATMMDALWHCHKIRNQFAHCNWGDDSRHPGLFFADLQASAKDDQGFEQRWNHVSVPLLKRQEDHFVYAQDWIFYVDHELALRVGKLQSHPFPRPTEQALPLCIMTQPDTFLPG